MLTIPKTTKTSCLSFNYRILILKKWTRPTTWHKDSVKDELITSSRYGRHVEACGCDSPVRLSSQCLCWSWHSAACSSKDVRPTKGLWATRQTRTLLGLREKCWSPTQRWPIGKKDKRSSYVALERNTNSSVSEAQRGDQKADVKDSQLLTRHCNRQHRFPHSVLWETLRKERRSWTGLSGSKRWCCWCPTDPPCPYKSEA